MADIKKKAGFVIKLAGWPTFKQNYQGRMEQGCWEKKALYYWQTKYRKYRNQFGEQMSEHNW